MALDVPPLKGRVNDYAGVMRREQIQSLESRLAQFEQDTGHQVAVLTLSTLEGDDIEGFSIRVAENWKIGQKGFDNGAILVVAVKDRRLRLEVGYGLEGVLPDAVAKRITSEYVVPHFRAQDYAGGIIAGIDAVLKIIKNEPLPPSARKKSRDQGSGSLAMLAVTLGVLAILALSSMAGRRRNQMWAPRSRYDPPIFWGGGGFGGGGFGSGDYGGGFSGGGGSFGGGGASDSW